MGSASRLHHTADERGFTVTAAGLGALMRLSTSSMLLERLREWSQGPRTERALSLALADLVELGVLLLPDVGLFSVEPGSHDQSHAAAGAGAGAGVFDNAVMGAGGRTRADSAAAVILVLDSRLVTRTRAGA